MNDTQLLRYSRHILLPEIGIEGQQSFLDAKVAIIGMGGLGSPAALYLAASGIGQLTLCDDDFVDLSNLQRQIIHRNHAIGAAKVASAALTISEINPDVKCIQFAARAKDQQLDELIAANDIVLDCSDNFATRYALNRACKMQRKPLVSGAAIQFSGMVSVFDFRQENSPCYECLFPEEAESPELRCATTGVFAPLTGLIGSLQAGETLKLLAGIGNDLSGKLLTVDSLTLQIKTSTLQRDPSCPLCAPSANL